MTGVTLIPICCYGLAGRPGTDMSTLARVVANFLQSPGTTAVVPGSRKQHKGPGNDPGYSRADRTGQVERVKEVSRILLNVSVKVVVAWVSPHRDDCEQARRIVNGERFVEGAARIPSTVLRSPLKAPVAGHAPAIIPGLMGLTFSYEVSNTPDLQIVTGGQTIAKNVAASTYRHANTHEPKQWCAEGRADGR